MAAGGCANGSDGDAEAKYPRPLALWAHRGTEAEGSREALETSAMVEAERLLPAEVHGSEALAVAPSSSADVSVVGLAARWFPSTVPESVTAEVFRRIARCCGAIGVTGLTMIVARCSEAVCGVSEAMVISGGVVSSGAGGGVATPMTAACMLALASLASAMAAAAASFAAASSAVRRAALASPSATALSRSRVFRANSIPIRCVDSSSAARSRCSIIASAAAPLRAMRALAAKRSARCAIPLANDSATAAIAAAKATAAFAASSAGKTEIVRTTTAGGRRAGERKGRPAGTSEVPVGDWHRCGLIDAAPPDAAEEVRRGDTGGRCDA